jgi:sporulation protein YlmC with PRC-barrel domain
MTLSSHALLWLAGLATVGALAQNPSTKADPQKHTPPPTTTPSQTMPSNMSHAMLDELIGADVVFENTTAGTDGDKASKKEEGKKGKVKDVVVGTNDGKIAALAVTGGEIGDRTILVPGTSATCNIVDKKPCYFLRMSKSELDGRPEFDKKKAEKDGLDKEVEQQRGASSAGKESPEPGVAPDKSDKYKAKGTMAYVLGTGIKGCEINAMDKHFGKVRDAAVDLHGNTVAYLFVSHGGVGTVGDTEFLVPFTATSWMREDDKEVIRLSKTVDEAKTAPEYKKPEQGVLTPEQMRSADAFWGKRPGP